MLKRILVAAIGIPLLLVVILFAPLWLLGAVVGIICACCAWEFIHCMAPETHPRMLCYAAVASFCIPFCSVFYSAGKVYETVLFFLFALMLGELMLSFRKEKTMDFKFVAIVLLGGGVLPILLSSIVRLGDRDCGSVYALLPFVAAFSSDTGGYFVGLALGRHKLTPHLSPNKTLEGSVGCFLFGIGFTLIYGLILRAAGYTVNLAVMGAYGFFGALSAQLGDLSFSAVKRLCGIKDFGKLLPGHGGMLDRFDSMVWTAALLELLASWVPAIVK